MGSTSKKQLEVTSESLQELVLERVAELVIKECGSNSQFKQRDQRTIAAVKEPKSLISLVKKQLAGLARGKKFYEARAASELGLWQRSWTETPHFLKGIPRGSFRGQFREVSSFN